MKIIISFITVCLVLLVSCDQSSDSGKNSLRWTLQREKQDDITYYSIFFTDKNNGWIIGYDGTIKKTSNGGSTWQTQQSNVSANLWEMSFINDLQGWICGANNTILKTSDGGKSWIDISPSESRDKIIVTIKFIDQNNGWISNNYGEILRTTNGGLSWEVKKSGHVGGSYLSVINAQTVYALSGKLFKTNNGGESWDSLAVSIPKNYIPSEMSFLNANNGWIVTENGTGGTMITELAMIYLIHLESFAKSVYNSSLIKGGTMRDYYRVVVDVEKLKTFPNGLFLESFITNNLFFKCSDFKNEGYFTRLIIPSNAFDTSFELVLFLPTHLIFYIATVPEEKKDRFGFQDSHS